MKLRLFKYASPFLLYIAALFSFFNNGFVVWIPMIYAWVLIPLVELFIKSNETNLSVAEEELAKNDKKYDLLLYIILPMQYLALGCFLYSISFHQQPWIDITGKTAVMGLLCGTFGINVGHELGHRTNKFEQFLAKSLLLSSLYMHFFIEHNRGHHKKVATPEDPSSARFGEMVYRFYFRSIIFSYVNAWKIANKETHKKSRAAFSIYNEMAQFQVIQLLFVAAIFFLFGPITTLLFLVAAINGILLLETVNYIEHMVCREKNLQKINMKEPCPNIAGTVTMLLEELCCLS